MINRLLYSRKIWGALLGSICLMIIVKLTPETHVPAAITAIGVLWGAAISGQAIRDIKNKE